METMFALFTWLAIMGVAFFLMGVLSDAPYSVREAYDRLDAWHERLLDEAEDFYEAGREGEYDLANYLHPTMGLGAKAYWTCAWALFRLRSEWLGVRFRVYRVLTHTLDTLVTR